jgi:hypothetical protein
MVTWIKNVLLAYGRTIKKRFTRPTRNWLIVWASSLAITVLWTGIEKPGSIGQFAGATFALTFAWLWILGWICLMIKPIKEIVAAIIFALYRSVVALVTFVVRLPALLKQAVAFVLNMTARDWSMMFFGGGALVAAALLAWLFWPFSAKLAASGWLPWITEPQHAYLHRAFFFDVIITYVVWGFLFVPIWLTISLQVKRFFAASDC